MRFNPDSSLSPNTEKYGAEKTPYLDTFDAVLSFLVSSKNRFFLHYILITLQ